MTEAEESLKAITKALEENVGVTKKNRDYAFYDGEVRKRVAEGEAQLARRKTVLVAADAAALLRSLIADEKAKIQTARSPAATDADLDAATKGMEAIYTAMSERTALEEQDGAYAAQTEKTRNETGTMKIDLELALKARDLRRTTVEALASGIASAESAAVAKDIRSQKALYDKALSQLRSCEQSGNAMLQETGALSAITVLVDGRPSLPKDVIALCVERLKVFEMLSKEVEGLVGFEDGPKKAYETGKALLKEEKKAEAIAQFRDCISSAAILKHWHPELEGRKLEVGGSSLTLPELIATCVRERDALQ